MSQQQAPMPGSAPKQGMGCGKMIAIGCVVIVILGVVGAGAAYYLIKAKLQEVIAQYTDEKPRQLPVVQAPKPRIDTLIRRVDAFGAAMDQGKPTPPLKLTADDINILINNDPKWKALAGKVHVRIEGDKLSGEVSLPLDELGSLGKGRYLNGTAAFTLELRNGLMYLYAQDIEVKGQPLPAQFMQQMRMKNLAEKSNADPKFQQSIAHIESIKIENGELLIVPKKPSQATAPPKAQK